MKNNMDDTKEKIEFDSQESKLPEFIEGTLTIKLGDFTLTRGYKFERYADSTEYIQAKLSEDTDELVETLLSDNNW